MMTLDVGNCGIDVSVVVPVYNVERYLRTSLDSLLAQTIPPGRMEIICVDDGSTDGCPDILREYEQRCQVETGHWFRVRATSENRGYGHAMNAGIAAARGCFVGILEPDDFAEPNMFNSLLAIAHEHDADVVKSNFYMHEDGIEPDRFFEVLQGHEYHAPLNVDADETIALLQPCIWTAIYRRAFLAHENVRFNETPGASYQDTAFAFQVYCCAKRLVLVNDAFVHYRIDNMASSVHSKRKELAIYDEIAKIEEFVNSSAGRRERLSTLALYREFVLHQWNIARIGDTDAAVEANLLMSAWLQRAHAEGRIDQSLFSDREMAAMIRLLHFRP